ncbi:MAG TPA: autotransporter outer membrane beta-barrel domain-containing protein [Bacteroidetes bacterium]|nr:autotransporter outer membrane beta-barrel domain-containing protein [Bacteroidota bacterium]
MNNQRIPGFFAIILFFSAFSLNAQTGFRELVNNYIERGSYEEQLKAEIPMAVIEPENGVFHTEEFAASFPDLRIEEEVFSIEHPDLSRYIDTIYVVWFLRDRTYSRTGKTNLIIFAVTPEPDVHYYFDNNNDRKFSPGETVVDFEPWEKERVIEMDFRDKNEYRFANPFYEPSGAEGSKQVNYEVWEKASRSLTTYMFGGFSFGRGDASVSYRPVTEGTDRIEYAAGIFASGRFTFGMGAGWRHLNLQAWLAWEVLDYDETWKYITISNRTSVNYNSGVWMKNKWYAGLELGYDIMLGKALSLGPAVSYSAYHVIGNKPIDPELEFDPGARYYNTRALEYIIRMRIISSTNSKLEMRMYYSDSSLDAREYFPDFDGDYASAYEQIYFGASYIWRFGK